MVSKTRKAMAPSFLIELLLSLLDILAWDQEAEPQQNPGWECKNVEEFSCQHCLGENIPDMQRTPLTYNVLIHKMNALCLTLFF